MVINTRHVIGSLVSSFIDVVYVRKRMSSTCTRKINIKVFTYTRDKINQLDGRTDGLKTKNFFLLAVLKTCWTRATGERLFHPRYVHPPGAPAISLSYCLLSFILVPNVSVHTHPELGYDRR